MLEMRLYTCGCVDYHDSNLWSSTLMDHCSDHSYSGDTATDSDVNLAKMAGLSYRIIDVEDLP